MSSANALDSDQCKILSCGRVNCLSLLPIMTENGFVDRVHQDQNALNIV